MAQYTLDLIETLLNNYYINLPVSSWLILEGPYIKGTAWYIVTIEYLDSVQNKIKSW